MTDEQPPASVPALPPPSKWRGACSEFGYADDPGMSGGKGDLDGKEDTGLTLYEHAEADRAKPLFNPGPPELHVWRRLRADALFCALPFVGRADVQPFRRELQAADVRVTNEKLGRSVILRLVDRGPHPSTGKLVDMSRAATAAIGVTTGDTVLVELLSPVQGFVLDPATKCEVVG